MGGDENEVRRLVDESMARISMEDALREAEAELRYQQKYGGSFTKVWPKGSTTDRRRAT